ncbi:MAG TPA: ATP-binding protein [Desulfobacteraceae bacterium]|nr:ATP-binding protein [Desulfobacteraceae bacterium]
MKRDIYPRLLAWKNSARRKPLVLRGARQTGKTYILQEFGHQEFEQVVYFNFEEDARLDSLFSASLDPETIIGNLSLYSKETILPDRHLIIFDEIQLSNNALNSLKYFQEKADTYHIAAAGSLLGITMSSPKSFPVGKVNFLDLFPMTFYEFLEGVGEAGLRSYLESLVQFQPLPDAFHQRLTDLLRKYYYCGGMPEAVFCLAQGGSVQDVRAVHKEILTAYALDFAKHAPTSDIPKLSRVWNSIVPQLAKENKKFMFSAIRKSARARDYENAIIWLEDAGLILRVFCTNTPKKPLKAYIEKDIFKVYVLDVGLLGAMADQGPEMLIRGEHIFHEFSGAFTENYAAQQLCAAFGPELQYWKNKSGKAEVDFLLETEEEILPLEVKAGINTKSKSLLFYNSKFNPSHLLRTSLRNLRQDGKTCNIPLYYLNSFPQKINGLSQVENNVPT